MVRLNDIIHICEKNIDGCGGYANVFAQVSKQPSEEELLRLENKLNKIKANARANDDCLDTDDMVGSAMDEVFGAGHWQCVFPYYAEF